MIFILFGFFVFEKANAGAGDNTSGWAWSENIGWISFNCNNPELPAPRCTYNYGVNINPSTGIFSGYAWSRGTDADVGGVGWISFADFDGDGDIDAADKNISGSPCAPNCEARLDLTPGGTYCGAQYRVCGWARALTDGGGWDGWIRLRGTNYGVSWNSSTQELEGWAWSDMVIGWISFNCKDGGYNEVTGEHYSVCGTSNYKVMTNINQPPSPPFNTSETINPCAWGTTPQVAPGLSVTLHWTYFDPEGDSQQAYEIWLDDNSAFPDPKFNHLVEDTSNSYALDLSQDDNSDWLSQLSWNTTYYWKVRVRDNLGAWSNWSAVDSFSTPLHASPYINFSWTPQKPTVNELVQFTDLSDVYYTKFSWLWEFPGNYSCENPITGCETVQNPSIKFSAIPQALNNKVYLTVTDSDGFSCRDWKPINVTLPLPEWEEISPF